MSRGEAWEHKGPCGGHVIVQEAGRTGGWRGRVPGSQVSPVLFFTAPRWVWTLELESPPAPTSSFLTSLCLSLVFCEMGRIGPPGTGWLWETKRVCRGPGNQESEHKTAVTSGKFGSCARMCGHLPACGWSSPRVCKKTGGNVARRPATGFCTLSVLASEGVGLSDLIPHSCAV